jgi:hypothetical protein
MAKIAKKQKQLIHALPTSRLLAVRETAKGLF